MAKSEQSPLTNIKITPSHSLTPKHYHRQPSSTLAATDILSSALATLVLGTLIPLPSTSTHISITIFITITHMAWLALRSVTAIYQRSQERPEDEVPKS